MSVPLSIRFDDSVLRRLRERASAAPGATTSGLAHRLVDEGLRQAEHPGVLFRDGPAGRRASLAGGPDVWEVIRTIQEVDERGDAAVEASAELLDLDVAHVRVAIRYYAEFGQEIDALIEGNRRAVQAEYDVWLAERRLTA